MTAAITDFTQYQPLRNAAAQNDPDALREVAGQFEALFIQSLMKNMREASLADPIFGKSDSLEMFQEMQDQQFAKEMASGRGIGLAEMIVKQLSRDSGATGEPADEAARSTSLTIPDSVGSDSARSGVHASQRTVRRSQPSSADSPLAVETVVRPRSVPEAAPTNASARKTWSDASEFAADIWPHVRRAAKVLNVEPVAILAQAALETGWGKHVMPDATGSSSLNLFGIKAGSGWDGESVRKQTLEFEHGVAKKETARFRAYESLKATFDDYASFLTDNPRYAAVSNHGEDLGGFANALQRAGYATDPDYAAKIKRVAQSPMMEKIVSGLKKSVTQSIKSGLAQSAQSTRL